MLIKEAELARWTEQLLCAFVLPKDDRMSMLDEEGKVPYFTWQMKEEVLVNALVANRNMSKDILMLKKFL